MIFLPVAQPTLQSVAEESVALLTLRHRSDGVAVGVSVGAHDVPSSSSLRVQRGVGRGQKAGRVWIGGATVVDGAVPSEAVRVRLARGPVPSPVFSRLGRPLGPGTSSAGAAVGRGQQLPLSRVWSLT